MLTSRVSGCKDSANRMKYQIYLRFSEVQPIFCVREAVTKISGNRTKKQIYLRFSEVQPIFFEWLRYSLCKKEEE